MIIERKCIKKSVYLAVHYCFVLDRRDSANMLTQTVWLFGLSLVSFHLVSCEDAYDKLFGEGFEPQTVDEVIARAAKGTSGLSTFDMNMGLGMKTEGMDMVVTDSQYRRLHSGVQGREDEHTTVATPWTDGIIPYTIVEEDFDEEQLQRIDAAMRNWEAVSCVQFRPATTSDVNNVTISSMKGCWAHLGMMGGAQKMSLNVWGCFWKGTVEHEFGHTLGLIHEHQRAQRDPYIKVDYYAVKPGNVEDLKKYADGCDDKMGLKFDYLSVMHYGKTAFTAKGKPTIYTVNPRMGHVIGMTLLPSFLDAKLINLMYKCKERCPRPRRCPGECFLTKDCTCFCPRDIDREICIDKHDRCEEFARNGDCRTRYGFMHDKCRKSCGICKTDSSVPRLPCVNGRLECNNRAQNGDCETDPLFMLRMCPKACGVCQEDRDYNEEARCVDRAHDCRHFEASRGCDKNPGYGIKKCRRTCRFCMENMNDPKPQGGCRDVDTVCLYWADNGMCNKHYTWMAINCPKACDQCRFDLPAGCTDDHQSCHEWAFRDECSNNPGSMLRVCKLSCNQCDGITLPFDCRDYHPGCPKFAELGECHFNKHWMRHNCLKSCGGCPGDSPTPLVCKDWHDRCDYWAKRDECTNNPTWMPVHCAQSCGKCGPGGTFLDPPTPEPVEDKCKDVFGAHCPSWASQGICEGSRSIWMRKNCRKSCRVCVVATAPPPPERTTPSPTPAPCEDRDRYCAERASRGECHSNRERMEIHCPVSCNFCASPVSDCVDRDQHCFIRARRGECETDPENMLRWCAWTCVFCVRERIFNPVYQ